MYIPRYYLICLFLLLFINVGFNVFNSGGSQIISTNLISREIVCLEQRLENEIVFNGSREKKEIALTFDADMTPYMKEELIHGEVKSWVNNEVINILEKTHTKATLFLTGMWTEIYPTIAKSLAHNPLFEIANHSYSHPSFSGQCYGLEQISDGEKINQIVKSQQTIESITGTIPKYFRFPGGCFGKKDLQLLTSYNLIPIQWDVVGNDGFNASVQNIYSNTVSHVQNGSIIVLHLHGGPNAPHTAEALLPAIQTLRAKGFTFVTVGQLLSNNTNACASDISCKL